MSSGDVRRTIEVQAEALGPLLHSGVASSLARALGRARGLKHRKYPHLLPLIMRAEMREHLEVNPLVDGWKVRGDSRKMGQLLLTQEDLNLELRFLKERRHTYPNGVPVAGKNQTRRDAWEETPFDITMPASRFAEDEPVRMLLLWDFADTQTLDQFTLRIVHTLAPGVYGKPVPCDLILDVRDGGEIFTQLEFTGSPDDSDLFDVIEIDEEDVSGT